MRLKKTSLTKENLRIFHRLARIPTCMGCGSKLVKVDFPPFQVQTDTITWMYCPRCNKEYRDYEFDKEKSGTL